VNQQRHMRLYGSLGYSTVDYEKGWRSMSNKPRPLNTRQQMTMNHPRWNEFLERLSGPEGCNFHEGVPGDGKTLTWTCDCTETCPLSSRILAEMGLTPDEIEESLEYFCSFGGYCDCEVVLNVGMR